MSTLRSASKAFLVYASSGGNFSAEGGIHIWLHPEDKKSTYLQILFGNIIAENSAWKRAPFEIFVFATRQSDSPAGNKTMTDLFDILPVSPQKIHYVGGDYGEKNKELIIKQSKAASLTIVSLQDDEILHGGDIFRAFDELGDILFVNATRLREIN